MFIHYSISTRFSKRLISGNLFNRAVTFEKTLGRGNKSNQLSWRVSASNVHLKQCSFGSTLTYLDSKFSLLKWNRHTFVNSISSLRSLIRGKHSTMKTQTSVPAKSRSHKTTATRLSKLKKMCQELHPYSVSPSASSSLKFRLKQALTLFTTSWRATQSLILKSATLRAWTS